MYSSDFLCTYKLLPGDDQDDMYRLQFLQAFQLEKWDDGEIESKTKMLYNSVNKNNNIADIIQKLKHSDKYSFIIQLVGDDDYSTFKILFMFELFDLAHKCFCDILNDGIINIDNKNMLLNSI